MVLPPWKRPHGSRGKGSTTKRCYGCTLFFFTFRFSSSDVEQMAIDWLTKNFYFVDDVDDRVFVCNKDGQTCVTLLDQELYNPKGIALDPTMGSVLCCRAAGLTLPMQPHFTS